MSSKKKLKVCPSIRKLKLEAIFHPKFDNEGPDTEIRTKMLTKVAANEGYIEASLKHSGSLLLWSGGEYFYSKNSTNNVFTKVGMILLRQHFSRCFGSIKGSQEYRRCSDYIQKNRLTCSFEVVTSVLGHHGEIPKRDYLILIAVADRSDGKGRFYSTSELVKFAHQFRLPHNDTWVFSSTASSEALFQIYDDMRETGTATSVINQLDQIIAQDMEEACTKVSSLYPHVLFQGDILEGIVIRYVSYTDTVGEKSKNLDEMEELCTASNELLQKVPPSQTMGHAPNISKCIHIENVNLRALASKGDFEVKVESVNQHLGGPPRRKVEWLKDTSHEGEEARTTAITCIDIISVANEILSASSTNKHDQETLAIAKLIQTLDELKINVSYQVFKERQGWSNDRKERCLCILHIRDDSSFSKYNTFLRQENSNGMMMLYRGFCIELVSNINSDDMHDNLNELWSVYTALSGDNDDNTTNTNKEEELMLKMKFLPYMVRTFICRNGLSILRQSGIAAFENHAITQLVKWGVSDASVRKWVPFFKGWARYCSSPDANLPQLTEKTYLHHYNKYDELYASGMFNPTDQTSSFPGLIVVVGHSKHKLKTLSQAMSKLLNCSKEANDINKITDKDVLLAMQPSGGLLCFAEIDSGCRSIRKLARQNHQAIYIIMIEEDVSKQSDPNVKKIKGMTESWKKTKCNMIFDLPKESTVQPDIKTTIEYLHTNTTAKEVMSKLKRCLKESSKSEDERPGLIVYFPSIPGSGKSSLCKDITSDSTLGTTGDRHLQLLEGDQVKKQGEGKFYDVVEKLLLTNPGSSVTILDKNVPPISFSAIHKLCAERKCISLPVLPMGMEDTIADNTCYPFSLQYLAVCISRVLQRQPNTHDGKLDSATENACMICIKYYCFYRNMTEATLKEKLQTVGGYQGEEILKVPFFKKDASRLDLPPNLKTVIEDAIILQTQDDTKKCKVTDKAIVDMETKLRSTIAKYQVHINNLTVSLDESRRSFVSELSRVIAAAMPNTLEPTQKESSTSTATATPAAGSIKIASLDLEYDVVHTAISQLRKSSSEVDDYFSHREGHKNNDEDDPYLDRFITSVHCTFAHSSQLSNSAMISTFRHLLGSTLDIKATSLLYNDKIAAMEIEIIPTSNQLDGNIPKPQNKFHHITIWCAAGTEAYESNALPKKVQDNEAKKVVFEQPIIMRGVFAFWYYH